MNLPTAEEINPYNDLGGKSAEGHFSGKSINEMTELFHEDIMAYQEDLMWMGPRAFEFYLPAVYNYISTPHAKDIADFIPYLKIAFTFQLEKYGEEIKIAFHMMNKIVSFIMDNIDQFDMDEYDRERWRNELEAEFQHIQKLVSNPD